MNEVICIVCPKGCRMKIHGSEVTGNACERGEAYGRAEIENPVRVITSTVKINSALHRRCPVKSAGAIPKPLVFKAMRALDSVELTARVHEGQVVVENICGTGIQFVATRDFVMRGDSHK